MGIIQHDAVIATTWDSKAANNVFEWMIIRYPGCGLLKSAPMKNAFVTLVLPPDGSKEGWEDSDVGDATRAHFIRRLREDAYEDGSNSWRWVEVSYGELGTRLTSGERPPE